MARFLHYLQLLLDFLLEKWIFQVCFFFFVLLLFGKAGFCYYIIYLFLSFIGYSNMVGTIPSVFPSSLLELEIGDNLHDVATFPALPPQLTKLRFDKGNLSGTIPPFPDTLKSIQINTNMLIGEFFVCLDVIL